MEQIDFALRQYKSIVNEELLSAAKGERYGQVPVLEIEAWITEYALRVAEDLLGRPVFREYATWAQRTLVPGAGTAERAAVERVDRGLTGSASALLRLAKNPAVAGKLEEIARAWSPPGVIEARIGAPMKSGAARGDRAILPLRRGVVPLNREMLEEVSRRAWTDLVCVADYFGPVGRMMRTRPLPSGVTEGAFVVSLWPQMFFVGDSISRYMIQRTRSWLAFLNEARATCYEALKRTGRPYAKQKALEQEAWWELHEAIEAVEAICLAGWDARLRDASMTLVQVYSAYAPRPELGWLGVPEEVRKRFARTLRHNIAVQRDTETVERIAAALVDLKRLYRELPPDRSAIDEAIATGRLVLIRDRREAYWEKKKIDADWNRFERPWELLWKLAKGALAASAVGNFDLYQEGVSNSTIANRWRRLKELLPPSLHRRVKPHVPRPAYRLDLRPHEIYLFPSQRGQDA